MSTSYRAGRRSQRGFTFIELMTSLTIIAILAAILLPRFVRARYRAYHSACIQNERMIATAIESYGVDNHVYPATLTVLASGNNYISALPVCPSNPATAYQTGYTISVDFKEYTLSCPGVHNGQLGDVRPGYPQYYSTGQLIDR